MAFLLISGHAGGKLKKKLIDEQEIVMNFADILAEAYIAESLLMRVQKLSEKADHDKKEYEVQRKLLKLHLYEALAKVRKAGNDAIESYAEGFDRKTVAYFLKVLTPKMNVNPKELRRAVANYAIEKNDYPFVM